MPTALPEPDRRARAATDTARAALVAVGDVPPSRPGRPNQHAAALQQQLSILLVWDSTAKQQPVGMQENYPWLMRPDLHAFEAPDPALVAVAVVNAGLPVPGNWSRRTITAEEIGLDSRCGVTPWPRLANSWGTAQTYYAMYGCAQALTVAEGGTHPHARAELLQGGRGRTAVHCLHLPSPARQCTTLLVSGRQVTLTGCARCWSACLCRRSRTIGWFRR
ncbi:hypothetical protein [Streptomyces sp. JV178]|uniref:hypothetical protein n=1 Tax=Streptomyces sp. JV178 TaxID=858632 RepID=UPI00117FECFB|nr:hypothetical protein [Streptomyces sp. JV178]